MVAEYHSIRTGDSFCGIGGIREGLEEASLLYKQLNPDTKLKFQCVWANDWIHGSQHWNEAKQKWTGHKNLSGLIYQYHWNDGTYHDQDIREVKTDDIPDIDIFTGGFPCQPHSLAGKREGFRDVRGQVFYEIIRILKAKRPKLFLGENVKGLLSSEGGEAFRTILGELGNIGYWCEWQVINCKHFGIPQNRERLFLIGHLREACTTQIFPIKEATPELTNFHSGKATGKERLLYWKNSQEQWVTAHRSNSPSLTCQTDLCRQPMIIQEHSFSGEDGTSRGYRIYDEGNCPTLSGYMGTGGNNVPMVVADRTRAYKKSGRNLESPKPIANTISSVQKDNLVILDHYPRKVNPKLGGSGPLMNSEHCFTLDSVPHMVVAGNVNNAVVDALQTGVIRIFMPEECEKLMDFKVDWTRYGHVPGKEVTSEELYDWVEEKLPDGTTVTYGDVVGTRQLEQPLKDTIVIPNVQRYRCIGNSVPVNVIREIGYRLLKSLEAHYN